MMIKEKRTGSGLEVPDALPPRREPAHVGPHHIKRTIDLTHDLGRLWRPRRARWVGVDRQPGFGLCFGSSFGLGFIFCILSFALVFIVLRLVVYRAGP